ncbi:RHS repeat-associated core domain-containing protein [Zobellia galactanivorans]|uniref:RHS repeat-associated core domain-containing protein n=1 Tax=Zobellia galactanivorans (strain DSM 12802 / CCUG 47099 / CIP 106680 / NCIMB 13871 / Dsij) TaxID=63186 RepID=UPI001C06E71C|nr:RHS repeat-associated core domain-containing protein [Zobellia galactanivorans]MBU3026762.1 VCBS repeat-containing protein [Zobellia galactanivorans]
MKAITALVLFLSFAIGLAQTDYTEVPLESEPIKQLDRHEENSETVDSDPNQKFKTASAFTDGGGESAISETVGELSVSLSGAAEYTVPIKVAPGINGVMPQIALAYNSQAGNGLVGYGWNLSGISIISRIPSTKYHDNNIDPVDFDALDRFALDGQRLLLKSGTYGGNGAQYETENFSNLKIVSSGVSPYGASYGPASFTVTYPDGSVAYYGMTSNSRSRTEYAITYWQNPQGVRIDYTYSIADNSLSIASIKYGHRLTATAPNEIRFVYKTRKRPEMSYIGGVEFRRKNILSQIQIKAGGAGYRNYVLSHDYNTLGYERLKSITEKSGDNSQSYGPISFTYPNTSTSNSFNSITTNLTVSNIEQRNARVIPLDYRSSGEMSFIVVPKTKSERSKIWLFDDFYVNNTNIGYQINTSTFEDIFPVTYLNAANKLATGQGFVLITNSGTNKVKFKVNGQSTYAAAAQYYEKTWTAPYYTSTAYCGGTEFTNRVELNYLSGDFNGDGLSDLVAISKPYSYNRCITMGAPCNNYPQPLVGPRESPKTQNDSHQESVPGAQFYLPPDDECCDCGTKSISRSNVYFINLDRRISSSFSNTAGGLSISLKPTDQLFTADVNGDGKTDILHMTPGKIYAYTLNANNRLQSLWTTSDSNIKLDYQPMLGDYNGDGKTDFMMPTATNSSSFALFLSTGTNFVKRVVSTPFVYKLSTTGTSPVTTYNLVPTDVNNDGRTDMLEYQTHTNNNGLNGSQTVRVYYNTFSTSSIVTPTFKYINSSTKSSELNHFPIPVFLTPNDRPNDNLAFATISNNRVFYMNFGKDNRQDMLLQSVSNNDVKQTITYSPLKSNNYDVEGNTVYTRLYDQVFPYVDIPTSLGTKVVTSLQRTLSGTPTVKRLFSYQGAVANTEGLGFISFSSVAQSSWSTSSNDRVWSITKHDISKRGAPYQSYSIANYYTFTTPSSGYITKTEYTLNASLLTNKVYKLRTDRELTQNGLEGTAITTNYLYDTYNNPIKISTDYSGQGSTVIDLTYDNSTGANYYIGRPKTRKETTTINGNSFSTEEQYTYTGYLLTTKKAKGNGTQFNTETYTYDAFGNIVKIITTPYNTSSRQVSFTYDSSGRYLKTSKDVEGLTTTFEHNTGPGTLKSETDPYGRSTSYLYDVWNRLTTVTDYLGKKVVTTYTKSSNNYTVTTTGEDGSGSIVVYDPLKRVTTIKEKDVLGQWVSKSFQYDKFDRPYKESEPYIGGAANQWNTTEYDVYGRPKTITAYTGKVTSMNYSGQTVTTNDGTKTVTATKNALGLITKVTDPGGTIDYLYYGNGNLRRSTYGGITVNVEQDGWGRRTKLIDPSAGTYTYAYNGFGEITKETTPKGSTDFTYNNVGKLTQKKVTGDATNMTWAYAYDGTTKLPTSVTLTNADGNNSTTTLAYDSYKRPTTTVETNAYARFATTVAYDAFGRVSTEEREARLLYNGKTSKVKVKNTYVNGQLKAIHDFNTNEELQNLIGVNARGQVTMATFGAGQRRTNTYDTYGYLTQAKAEKNVTATAATVMALGYDFDTKRGILKSRSNSLFGWSETFTYDSQDRLLTFNDNNGNNSHTYDNKGRIDVNSQLGQYQYTSTDFRHIGLDLNAAGQAFYQNRPEQQVSYNAFKSPVEINESGKERYSFQYNAGMGRATMFFGDTKTEQEERRYRRHYSEDGSMEITWDKTTGKTVFTTYVGGDAYTAPAIFHSEQTSENTSGYLYLHRDYLGSILAITDKDGNLKEKRHFDAWGNPVKWTNGSGTAITGGMAGGALSDRGFTGHEHLFGANLIHMNGRLYDPALHRFLIPDNFVQDPYSTLSYNRYSYVWNNPLMYVDPSGEAAEWIVTGIAVAVWAIFNVAKTVHEKNLYEKGLANNAPVNQLPTPTSGQNASQNTASGMGPEKGEIRNLEVPVGIAMPYDRYIMDTDGNVKYYDNKGGDKVDYLMYGNEEIQVNDTGILPQLESNTASATQHGNNNLRLKGHYAITANHYEAKRLYEWVASRNPKEWTYIKANTSSGTKSFLGTLHQNSQGLNPSPGKEGFGDFSIINHRHSHYGTELHDFQPSDEDRIYASGVRSVNPDAQFSIFSPHITKDKYNRAILKKVNPSNPSQPLYKPLNYEPSKYIQY